MDNNVQNTANKNGLSVTSLVFGIVSIVLSWVSILNIVTLVLGIVGIVLGVKGRKKAPVGKTGLATAGLICSIIGTVFSAIGFFTCTLCVICSCGAAGATSLY